MDWTAFIIAGCAGLGLWIAGYTLHRDAVSSGNPMIRAPRWIAYLFGKPLTERLFSIRGLTIQALAYVMTPIGLLYASGSVSRESLGAWCAWSSLATLVTGFTLIFVMRRRR